MEGGDDVRESLAALDLAALLRDAKAQAEKHLGGGRAEGDDDRGMDRLHLAFEPLVARLDLALRRRLVQAPLAPGLPLEVLHRVRDVRLRAIDSGLVHGLVQDAAGGPHERVALPVLDVAGLLADEHNAGARVALPEDRLGRVLPQRAIAATRRGLAQALDLGR